MAGKHTGNLRRASLAALKLDIHARSTSKHPATKRELRDYLSTRGVSLKGQARLVERLLGRKL